MRCHPLTFGDSSATRNEDVLRYRREVEVEREFSAGPREDGELGLRERIEVAVREGCDHLGAIGRGFRPGGRAVGRVVRADSHRHDLSVALDEHDEGVLREVTAVAVERDGYLKVLVVQDPPDLLIVRLLGAQREVGRQHGQPRELRHEEPAGPELVRVIARWPEPRIQLDRRGARGGGGLAAFQCRGDLLGARVELDGLGPYGRNAHDDQPASQEGPHTCLMGGMYPDGWRLSSLQGRKSLSILNALWDGAALSRALKPRPWRSSRLPARSAGRASIGTSRSSPAGGPGALSATRSSITPASAGGYS